MQKGASVQEKEKDLCWVLISGDEGMIEIRTPLRICINSGLNIAMKIHELQHGDRTIIFTQSAGRTKKQDRASVLQGKVPNELVSAKSKHLRGLCLRYRKDGSEAMKDRRS